MTSDPLARLGRLTTRQAARSLGITPVAVRRACRRGRLTYYQDGPGLTILIPEWSIEDYRREYLGRRGPRRKS